MIIFFLISIINLVSALPDQPIELKLNKQYTNLSTKGSLLQNLYNVPIDKKHPPQAVRVVIASEKSMEMNPLTFVAVRGKSVMNSHLPQTQVYNHETSFYWFTAQTICEEYPQLDEPVSLTIASHQPTYFDLKVATVPNFVIRNKTFVTRATTSEPRFYYYTFPETVDQVNVKVTSESNICGRITVRKAQCPVIYKKDTDENDDYYYFQTFTKFAYFTVEKSKIGKSIHVIYTVNHDDSACNKKAALLANYNRFRKKTVNITLIQSEESSTVPITLLCIYITALILATTRHFYLWFTEKPLQEAHRPASGESEPVVPDDQKLDFETMISVKEYTLKLVSFSFTNNGCQIFVIMVMVMTTVFQIDFFRFQTINLDACNRNFVCAYSFMGFESFNSMASAASVVVVGLLGLLSEWRRYCERTVRMEGEKNVHHGTSGSTQPGITFSLNVIALGLLWTVTSNCPQKTTIHFYAFTLVWMMFCAMNWLYSKRHSDRQYMNTSIMFVSSVYALMSSAENAGYPILMMRIFVALFAVITTFWFGLVYCNWKPDLPIRINSLEAVNDHLLLETAEFTTAIDDHPNSSGFFRNMLCCQQNTGKGYQVLPDNGRTYLQVSGLFCFVHFTFYISPIKFLSKIILIVVLVIWNVLFTVIIPFFTDINVTTTVIRLIEGDLFVYFFYYILQKIRLEKYTFGRKYLFTMQFYIIVLILIVISWDIIFVNFDTVAYKWSPAASRTLNRECLIQGIDWHSILQFLAAAFCGFLILALEKIDSNVDGIVREHIYVF